MHASGRVSSGSTRRSKIVLDAIGTDALVFNDTAEQNTATGAFALFSHVSGNGNTANGWHALFSDTAGQVNTAVGASALANNISLSTMLSALLRSLTTPSAATTQPSAKDRCRTT